TKRPLRGSEGPSCGVRGCTPPTSTPGAGKPPVGSRPPWRRRSEVVRRSHPVDAGLKRDPSVGAGRLDWSSSGELQNLLLPQLPGGHHRSSGLKRRYLAGLQHVEFASAGVGKLSGNVGAGFAQQGLHAFDVVDLADAT